MDRRQKSRNRLRWTLVFAFFFGLFLAACPWASSWQSLAPHPYLRKFLEEVAPKIGDALMIAPLLVIAIEYAATHELLIEFTQDVTSLIVGNLLPARLREHIAGYLKLYFVRTWWQVTYRIEELPNYTNHVRLLTTSKFDLQNFSHRPRDYDFSFEVQGWFEAVGKTTITHVSVSDGGTTTSLNHEQLEKLVKAGGGFLKYAKTIRIDPGRTYRFTTQSEEYYPDGYDATFVATLPVLEMDIEVEHPREFKVEVNLSYGDGKDLDQTELEDGTSWKLNTPMMPGQSFVTRWARTGSAPLISSRPSYPDVNTMQAHLTDSIRQLLVLNKKVRIDFAVIAGKYSATYIQVELVNLLKQIPDSTAEVHFMHMTEDSIKRWGPGGGRIEDLGHTQRVFDKINSQQIKVRKYEYNSIPPRHGILVDGELLYAAETEWEDLGSGAPTIRAAGCRYTRYDTSDDEGQRIIANFKNFMLVARMGEDKPADSSDPHLKT
jgi:hypothetical protein